ncbi:MAG: SIS domain-containing protein [Polyangiales bacterium]
MAFDASARAHDNVSVLDPFANEARECFKQQAAAISALAGRIDRRFGQAVRALHAVSGHVIITGSASRDIDASSPPPSPPPVRRASSCIVGGVPRRPRHGSPEPRRRDPDLVQRRGPPRSRACSCGLARGVPTIALVGKVDSTLGRGADITLDVSVDREVDPNGLAPTSSTLAALAMGDALYLVRMRVPRRDRPPPPVGPASAARAPACEKLPKASSLAPRPPFGRPFALANSALPVAAVVSHGVLVGSIGEAELRDALGRGGRTNPWAVHVL